MNVTPRERDKLMIALAAEGAGSKLSAELLEKAAQGEPQVVGHLRGKANDNKPANQRRGAGALQGTSNVAKKL
jgi:hypothetical protein